MKKQNPLTRKTVKIMHPKGLILASLTILFTLSSSISSSPALEVMADEPFESEWVKPLPATCVGGYWRRFYIVPDLDGDGLADIVIHINTDTTEYNLYAINRNGTVLWNHPDALVLHGWGNNHLLCSWDTWWTPVLYDENNDGIIDILVYYENSTSGIVSGKDGTSLAKLDLFSPSRTMLRWVIPDVNGDGKPEIVAKSGRGSGTMDGYVGVMDSATKALIWSKQFIPTANPNDRDVEMEIIPDINGNGAWEIVCRSYWFPQVSCLDGLTGESLWNHSIGFDCWAMGTIRDITGDGISEILVPPQLSDFEVLSGKDGSSYWSASYAKSHMPTGFVSEEGLPIVAFDDMKGELRIYDMSSKILLGTVPVSPMQSGGYSGCNFGFMESPDPQEKDFHLVVDKVTNKATVYYIGEYDAPTMTLDGSWQYISPYYSNTDRTDSGIVVTSDSQIAFFKYEGDSDDGATTVYITTTAFISGYELLLALLTLVIALLVRKRRNNLAI